MYKVGRSVDLPMTPQEAWRHLGKIKFLVLEQAEDPALWFEAQTAPEAYLQAALRRLHAVIEQDPRIEHDLHFSSPKDK